MTPYANKDSEELTHATTGEATLEDEPNKRGPGTHGAQGPRAEEDERSQPEEELEADQEQRPSRQGNRLARRGVRSRRRSGGGAPRQRRQVDALVGHEPRLPRGHARELAVHHLRAAHGGERRDQDRHH